MYVDSSAAGNQSLEDSDDTGDACIGNLVNSKSQMLSFIRTSGDLE